jgi:hypothetical protein
MSVTIAKAGDAISTITVVSTVYPASLGLPLRRVARY